MDRDEKERKSWGSLLEQHLEGKMDEMRKEMRAEIRATLDEMGDEGSEQDLTDEDRSAPRYLSITELERTSGISRQTLHKLVKDGRLPFYKLPGNSRKLFRMDDLEELIERVEVPVHRRDDYGEFESRLRKAADRGKRLKKLAREYARSTGEPDLSGLAQFLYERGEQDLIKGALVIDLD